MNKVPILSVYSNILLSGCIKYMARRQRKTIEDKIAEKEKIIKSLNIRIEKEGKELKALLSEQKQKEVEILYDFIKTSHLGLNEATEVLQQYLSNKYEATA